MTKTALKTKTIRTAKPRSAAATKRDVTATRAGIAYAAIGAAGMALSLSHQAHGVAHTTTSTDWQAWAMAMEIDLGLIAAKLTPYLCKSAAQRDAVDVYAKPLAYGALLLCAWFNSCGFAGFEPTGYLRAVACIVLGCAVPAIIFALSQMAAILLLDRKG